MENTDSKDSIASLIADVIMVSLRKGVFTDAACELYNAVNPMFFLSDKALRSAASEYVMLLGSYAESAYLDDTLNKKEKIIAMAESFKQATLQYSTVSSGKSTISGDVHGKLCLKKLTPVLTRWDEVLTYDEENSAFILDKVVEPRGYGYISDDNMFLARDVIIKMTEMFPEVRAYFADELRDLEEDYRKAVYKAGIEMDDESWQALADSVMYYIGDV